MTYFGIKFFVVAGVVCSFCSVVHGFQLEGSPTSYAKFPKWSPCANGSLRLEFKTNSSNGLLLYLDDGGINDYVELKLVLGMLRLQMHVGNDEMPNIMVLGFNLNDDRWHRVEIKRSDDRIILVLDDKLESEQFTHGPGLDFGIPEKHANVFIGGLPVVYHTRLRYLCLPSVVFEPHFQGEIRNLLYSNCGSSYTSPVMIDSEGVRTNNLDRCQDKNPCLNKGLCISTDSGTLCDCAGLEYEGPVCEIARKPIEVTFYGKDFLSYNLSSHGDPIISSTDSVSLSFKTPKSDGLIFYTGDGYDYLKIVLKDGYLYVRVNLGSGAFNEKFDSQRLDDNSWHHVYVWRESRKLVKDNGICNVKVKLNGTEIWTGTTTGDYTMLSSRELFVGGATDPLSLRGTPMSKNFNGCMKTVLYKADSISLDITDLARNKHDLINSVGNVKLGQCDDLTEQKPITFRTPESFIKVPQVSAAINWSISVQFRTTELNGLIFYAHGNEGVNHFVGLELLAGLLYLVTDVGTGSQRISLPSGKYTDGTFHTVSINQTSEAILQVQIDKETQKFVLQGEGGYMHLNGAIFVGGFDYGSSSVSIPYKLWSGVLRYGYVGCLQDLCVNGEKVNLAGLARAQQTQGVSEYCHTMEPQCPLRPCIHRGVCSEGWNRHHCDCSRTGYTGNTCSEVATSLSFNGSQYIRVTLPEPKESQTEDVSLRFKTSTPKGLLFITYQKGNRDRMELYLLKGKLRCFIHIGTEKKIKMVPKTINKNEWYSVQLKRRGKLITLILNNSTSVEVQLNGATDVLKYGGILIGGRPPGHHSHGKSKTGFIGHMQKFVFNGQHYFEMARDTNDKNIEVLATFDQKDKLVDHPLTIKSSVAYLTTKFKPYSTFTLYFQFKTTQPNGLILYSNGGGEGKDFMAVELVEGKVHYTFDTGGGVRTVRSQATLLNNNKWHEVAIVRPTLAKHILRVDSQVTVDEMPGKRVVHFDVDDQFFVGGVPEDLWSTIHNQIQSREGYQGCLASFYLDEVTKNFMEGQGHIEEQFKDAIIEGCEGLLTGRGGPSADCQQNHCLNHGVCVQEWNLVRCDCDMTSYTGNYCQTESAAYTFRGDGGLIKFTYREENRRDTEVDRLAFGFMTEQRDCVLVRIESGNSNDYIEMELLSGNLFLVYNMGSMNHPVGLFTEVSDGKYHIINFVRHGPNATLSLLDSGQAQPKHPEGHQLSIFNNVARVYIGGKVQGEKIQRPFRGTIIGLVLNRVHISELASENDNRVHVMGDVQLEPRPVLPARPTSSSPSQSSSYHSATPASKMMSTMRSKGSGRDGVTDDLIASGSTPDCNPDDCYDVTTITDGIIRPTLKVITTPRPSTTPSTTPVGGDKRIIDGSGQEPCDDEEECGSGSGGGELPSNKEDISFPTSPQGSQSKGSTDFPHNSGANETVTNADLLGVYNMTSSTPKALTRSTTDLHTSVTEPRYNDRHAGSTQIPGVTGKSASIWSGFNLYVFLGIAGGVAIVLVILAYAFYKYKSKDEGTYKIDESKNYDAYEERKPMTQANGGYNKSGPLIGKPVKKKSVKEWYV